MKEELKANEKDVIVVSEEQKESFMQMIMKTKEIYNNVLQEYFSTPAVVRLIYMENRFRLLTKEIKSIDELKDFMIKELDMMRSKENMTRIEIIEYRLAKKIYRDVIEGKGKEIDFNKPLSYNYDEQKMEFEDIKMGQKELYDSFEQHLLNKEKLESEQ
ncbi:MAG: hypothetical protein WC143_08200 [Eubacteriales bacterium]|jgi:hypothetical protein|nr:hypothetical protein [Clostridia bacterium]